jgi:hypothetical protein
MLVKLMLQLRDHRDEVSVVRPNGTTRVVLGTRHPGEEDMRRASAAAHWGESQGDSRPAPRQTRLGAIEEPLPQRTQTILSTRVSVSLQNELNGGIAETLPNSRVASAGNVTVKMKVQI